MRILLLLLVLPLILLPGALGLRASIAECDNDPNFDRDSQYMDCYHTVAITQAYLNSPDAAATCATIWQKFGGFGDSDVIVKAEMVTNACYYDVALITRNPSLCTYIYSRREKDRDNWADTELFGDEVTQDRCYREAEKLARLAPEHYYESNADNLCALIFVLPLLVLKVFIGP